MPNQYHNSSPPDVTSRAQIGSTTADVRGKVFCTVEPVRCWVGESKSTTTIVPAGSLVMFLTAKMTKRSAERYPLELSFLHDGSLMTVHVSSIEYANHIFASC